MPKHLTLKVSIPVIKLILQISPLSYDMKKLFIVFLFFSLTACNRDKSSVYVPEGLRELSETELIELIKEGEPFPETTLVKDSLGNIIAKEELSHIDDREFYGNYYVNEENELEEIVLRKDADYVRARNQKLTEALAEDEPMLLVDVDCSNVPEILEEVYETDQASRQGEALVDPEIDWKNQQIVVSIIENCGFPTVDEQGHTSVQAVFLVIQHAGKDLRTKYFPLVKESAERGDLSWSTVALMEDRMLKDNGEKQKYGSQVEKLNGSNLWTLYPIDHPETVDARRAKVGLEPLEDYLRHFDIEYNPITQTAP